MTRVIWIWTTHSMSCRAIPRILYTIWAVWLWWMSTWTNNSIYTQELPSHDADYCVDKSMELATTMHLTHKSECSYSYIYTQKTHQQFSADLTNTKVFSYAFHGTCMFKYFARLLFLLNEKSISQVKKVMTSTEWCAEYFVTESFCKNLYIYRHFALLFSCIMCTIVHQLTINLMHSVLMYSTTSFAMEELSHKLTAWVWRFSWRSGFMWCILYYRSNSI